MKIKSFSHYIPVCCYRQFILIPLTMKVALLSLSEKEFNQILYAQNNNLLNGSGLEDINIFRSKRYLQGSGFFDFIKGVGSFLFPLAKKYVAPSLGEFAQGMVSDIAQGKNIKSTLKHRGKKGLKQIGSRILQGRGLKRGIRKSVKSNSRKHNSAKKKPSKNKKKSVKGCGNNKMKINKKRKKNQSGKKTRKRSRKSHLDIFS